MHENAFSFQSSFDGLRRCHLRMVITKLRFLERIFTFVVNAEAQSVLGFSVEEIQSPANYFKLG